MSGIGYRLDYDPGCGHADFLDGAGQVRTRLCRGCGDYFMTRNRFVRTCSLCHGNSRAHRAGQFRSGDVYDRDYYQGLIESARMDA